MPYRPRVLIVEDDHSTAKFLLALFEAMDFNAMLALTVEDARQRLALVEFRMVVLDLGLPGGDGSELLAELAARKPRPIVIVCSGRSVDIESFPPAIRPDHVKAKPIDPHWFKSLAKVVRDEFRAKSTAAESVRPSDEFHKVRHGDVGPTFAMADVRPKRQGFWSNLKLWFLND